MQTPRFHSGNLSPGPVLLAIIGGFCCFLLLVSIVGALILHTLIHPMDMDKVIRANETSAIRSIKKINAVEGVYRASRPQKGYACSLLDFNWSPKGEPAPQQDQMIDADLEYGQKNGYTFLLTVAPAMKINNVNLYSDYTIVAIPISFNQSGRRTFCSGQNGQIRFDPKGGSNCIYLIQ